MALFAIYIDGDNKAHTSDDAKKEITAAYANELAKYKLCPIVVNDLADAKVAPFLDDTQKEWKETDKKQKADLEKETNEANKEEKAANDQADTDEKKALKAEDKVHETNRKAIEKDPTLNPAQRVQRNAAENQRHQQAKTDIGVAKTAAKTKSGMKKEDRIKKFKEKQKPPTAISVKCGKAEICGTAECKLKSMGTIQVNNKDKITITSATLANIADLSENHVYFCTCGEKG